MKTIKQQEYHQKRCSYCEGTGVDILNKENKCPNCSNKEVIIKKNECGKTVKIEDAYEIWESKDHQWLWYVLKKYQIDDEKQYARWFCWVTSPFMPAGEYGDEYVENIKRDAIRIK